MSVGYAGRSGQAGSPARASTIRGADISFTAQLEAAGAVFADADGPAALERILARAGCTHVRLRVWHRPPDGYSDADSALLLARRAHEAGMGILLDPHYSDFWADPGKQTTPGAWQGQNPRQLADTVRGYTADLVAAFATQGTPVEMVQVGNEVTNGMLWPTGQIYTDEGERWAEFASLLAAGIDGVREAGDARVMLHIDRGGNNADCRYFYDRVLEQGIEFDVIGLSFYPFWHGSTTDLESNLADLATRYDKDLVVTETSYPWTLADGDDEPNFVSEQGDLPDPFPATPAGQADYLHMLDEIVAANPAGLGWFVWEPGWLPVLGWEPGAGNPNDNLTLFDWDGQALPGLGAFGAA